MAGVKCEFVHHHTSADHPETVYFIRREKERLKKAGHNLIIDIPRYPDGTRKTMWSGIYKKGLPTRLARWCCSELKEYGGEGRYCIFGIRWEESPARRKNRALHEDNRKILLNNDNHMKRHLAEICTKEGKAVLNPIIDWKESDVWEFIKERNIPYNPLYDTGYKRVGCIGCPMNTKSKKELYRLPKYLNAYRRAAKEHLEYRKARGLKTDGVMQTLETYFEWWLRGKYEQTTQEMYT
jgi:phosphoadenosine phosphosulfate reductase